MNQATGPAKQRSGVARFLIPHPIVQIYSSWQLSPAGLPHSLPQGADQGCSVSMPNSLGQLVYRRTLIPPTISPKGGVINLLVLHLPTVTYLRDKNCSLLKEPLITSGGTPGYHGTRKALTYRNEEKTGHLVFKSSVSPITSPSPSEEFCIHVRHNRNYMFVGIPLYAKVSLLQNSNT